MDDLNTPLTAPPAKRRLPIPKISAGQVTAGVLGLFLAVFVGWALVVEDPQGGDAMVEVAIKLAPATKPASSAGASQPHASGKAPDKANAHEDPASASGKAGETPPRGKTVTIIDGSSGKRQEVAISGPPEQNKRPEIAASIADKRLLENTRHGPIPRIGPNGLRSVDAYSRPEKPTGSISDGPKIAIVVSGLGIGASATVDALSRLPPAVTLGFVPYGAELAGFVAQARDRGHEVLLQVPMEPFDYPDNDPGPRTLLTGLPREQNLDRLHWLMSRLQGYVGIMNYMGAKFIALDKALAPVMDDAAKRGLMYFDDGSSTRSQAGHIANAVNMTFAKAQLTIDAVPTPAEIDRTLLRLERMARERGTAIGSAGVLPVTIDRIARWARGLEARGIRLVPITAVASKAKSS